MRKFLLVLLVVSLGFISPKIARADCYSDWIRCTNICMWGGDTCKRTLPDDQCEQTENQCELNCIQTDIQCSNGGGGRPQV